MKMKMPSLISSRCVRAVRWQAAYGDPISAGNTLECSPEELDMVSDGHPIKSAWRGVKLRAVY
jgi:hypothetical protein